MVHGTVTCLRLERAWTPGDALPDEDQLLADNNSAPQLVSVALRMYDLCPHDCLPNIFTKKGNLRALYTPLSPLLWVSLIGVLAFGLLFCVIDRHRRLLRPDRSVLVQCQRYSLRDSRGLCSLFLRSLEMASGLPHLACDHDHKLFERKLSVVPRIVCVRLPLRGSCRPIPTQREVYPTRLCLQ